jgi:hypothetical protein
MRDEWRGNGGSACGRGTGALGALAALALGACAVGEPIEGAGMGINCLDDSPRCISEREAALKTMVADPQRRWVKEAATPSAYASGVRLFAYKSTKKSLTCDELHHGKREADGAAASLKGAGSGLSPAQVSRSTMFAGEVSRELAGEIKRRCKS